MHELASIATSEAESSRTYRSHPPIVRRKSRKDPGQLTTKQALVGPFWAGGFSACVLGRLPDLPVISACPQARPFSTRCFSSGTLAGSPLLTTSITSNNHFSFASTPRRPATRSSPSPERASPLFLILLMALGGLGAILLAGHPSLSISHVLSQVDLRSVFLAVVIVIIVLVLGA